MVNSPKGTVYSVDGGVIHAGCASRTGCIRAMLFWTAQRKGEEPYKSDSQHTVLSLLVQLFVLIWENLSTEENRFEMIHLFSFFFTIKCSLQKDLLLYI